MGKVIFITIISSFYFFRNSQHTEKYGVFVKSKTNNYFSAMRLNHHHKENNKDFKVMEEVLE